MAIRYMIHPAVGVARLGNSTTDFYLAPESIGGRPLQCDDHGNAIEQEGKPQPVNQFKDAAGRVKRQGAKFRIFKYDDSRPGSEPTEVTLDDAEVAQIEWVSHVANKKAAWWNFAELGGNLLFGEENSYEALEKKGMASLRNASSKTTDERRKLIIDPGPRRLSGRNLAAEFSKETIPADYKFGSFPDKPQGFQGALVQTLGSMRTDEKGRLVVIGAHGNAGGNNPITSYAGADTWHDDIADGPVWCRLRLKDGQVITLDAWVLVGSPKFAPELVNISTLSDTALDVAIRYHGLVPEMFDKARWPETNGWNPDYEVNFDRDIAPLFDRPADYIWVSNVPSMVAFTRPHFDRRDNSEANRQNRENYFRYWRRPGFGGDSQRNQLFSDTGLPLMPINSGTNSVNNYLIDKFLTLDETQYYMLGQWAKGRFNLDKNPSPYPGVHPLDEASVGNCVGLPMSPGIEVTWSVQNPALYDPKHPYRMLSAHGESHYLENGLNPHRDETRGGGCEPGDLTKRMAIPWQADFFQCTIQYVNFTDPNVNKTEGIPLPPSYYSYWWPPQSPWDVMSGPMTAEEQRIQGVPAGVQVNYARGINSFSQMITAWSYLGFVVNQNTSPDGRHYPYFVERERNNDMFEAASVAVGRASDVLTGDNQVFQAVWYLKEEAQKNPGDTLKSFAASTGEEDKPTRVQASLGLPRMGTRVRF